MSYQEYTDQEWAEIADLHRAWREHAATLTDPEPYEPVSYDEVSLDVNREFYPVPAEDDDPAQAACERTVAGGRCTLCEAEVTSRLPWGSEHLCWECVDLQLDLLAKAIQAELPEGFGAVFEFGEAVAA